MTDTLPDSPSGRFGLAVPASRPLALKGIDLTTVVTGPDPLRALLVWLGLELADAALGARCGAIPLRPRMNAANTSPTSATLASRICRDRGSGRRPSCAS